MNCLNLKTFVATLFAFAACAHGATIRTLDGQIYDGPVVSLGGDQTLAIQPRGKNEIKIRLAEILDANFRPADGPMHLGLVLTNGETLVASITNISDAGVRCAGSPPLTIPLKRVARLIYGDVSPAIIEKIPAGHTGAVLVSGDFFDGEIKDINQTRVIVSSVLFGISNFDLGRQASVVVLADVELMQSDYIVTLTDGTILPATSLKIDSNRLIVHGQDQDVLQTPADRIASIRCGSARRTALGELPGKVDPSGDVIIDATASGAATALPGVRIEHSVSAPVGSSIHYSIDGKYRLLTAQAGVPAALAPATRVKFVISGDGKELFRSDLRSSIDPPLSISVKVSGFQQLTLKIESDVAQELGACGIWGDASLIR